MLYFYDFAVLFVVATALSALVVGTLTVAFIMDNDHAAPKSAKWVYLGALVLLFASATATTAAQALKDRAECECEYEVDEHVWDQPEWESGEVPEDEGC